MSAPVRENSTKDGTPAAGRTGSTAGAPIRTGSELLTPHGKTAIADVVVGKIAGMAAREVPGVYAMGAGISRAIGAMRERLAGGTRSNLTQGVAVEVGQRQAAVDMDLVAEYGVSIPNLAEGVRRNVIDAVERMCGLEVIEVNVAVGDIHLPDDDSPARQTEPRVQ
jgi:uncharacterized alkaline shock family protein YloU